jgi:hypothetical protein
VDKKKHQKCRLYLERKKRKNLGTKAQITFRKSAGEYDKNEKKMSSTFLSEKKLKITNSRPIHKRKNKS